MPRYNPTLPDPNKRYPASVSHSNHRPCAHCGHAGHAHDRTRVHPDGGPAGSYHVELRCPT